MEEKKTKNVEMKQPEEKRQRLTYEQLNETCAQLYQQNQQLARQVSQLNMSNMFKRLDYLFLVLQHASVINDAKFVQACVDEIKEAMTVKEEESKEG